MDDLHLRRVLRSIDDPAPVPTDFADRLWADVRATLERDEAPEGVVVVPMPEAPATTNRRRPILAAAAVILLVVGVGIAWFASGDPVDQQLPADVPTAVPLPTVEPQPLLDDPDLACERFVGTSPDLQRLGRDLRDGTDVIVDLDRARTAYRALIADLDAAGFDASVVTNLEIGAGSLDQARLRIIEGDLPAAGRAVENAVSQLNTVSTIARDALSVCFS